MSEGGVAVIGRDKELATIGDFLSARDLPAALVLEGEPGIGKTALLRRGIAEASFYRVLAAAPVDAERHLSFAALTALFEGVSEQVLAELPPPQRHALEVALLLRDAGVSEPDPRAIGAAVHGLFRMLSRSGPVRACGSFPPESLGARLCGASLRRAMYDGAAPLARIVEHAHCLQAVGHLLGEPALDPRRLRKLGGVEEFGQRQREQARGVSGRGEQPALFDGRPAGGRSRPAAPTERLPGTVDAEVVLGSSSFVGTATAASALRVLEPTTRRSAGSRVLAGLRGRASRSRAAGGSLKPVAAIAESEEPLADRPRARPGACTARCARERPVN